MDTDDSTASSDPQPHEPAQPRERQDPAALHADHDEHLQDPDAELSGSLAPDSYSLNTFQPVRFN